MAKRKTNKRVTVNLQPWEYNPTTLRGLDIKDLRSLYSAKRDIAQKRLKRLKQSEFKGNQSVIDYKKGVPTLKQIRAESEKDAAFEKNILTYELSKLNTWLENEYTKVGKLKEIKAKSLVTLHQNGYDWVNSSNYMDFVDFQNYLTSTGLDRWYDSDQERMNVDKNGKVDTERLKTLFYEYLKNDRKLPDSYHLSR